MWEAGPLAPGPLLAEARWPQEPQPLSGPQQSRGLAGSLLGDAYRLPEADGQRPGNQCSACTIC